MEELSREAQVECEIGDQNTELGLCVKQSLQNVFEKVHDTVDGIKEKEDQIKALKSED